MVLILTPLVVSSQPNSTLFNGMTRKQMEEERLARIEQRSKEPNAISKKRKASLSSPTTSPSDRHQPKVSRSGPIPHQMTVKNRQVESTTRNSAGNGPNYTLDQSSSLREPDSEIDIEAAIIPGKLHRSLKSQGDISETGIQFPLGVVKKTWAQGFPREDDIKIEEVLQSSTLEHAILGAFQIDSDWIRSKIQPSTKVIWVLQAKTEAEVSRMFFILQVHTERQHLLQFSVYLYRLSLPLQEVSTNVIKWFTSFCTTDLGWKDYFCLLK